MKSLWKYFFIVFVVCSCSSESELERLVKMMYGTSINIPLDSMKCWHPAGEDFSSVKEGSKLKLVVYSDTTDCSTCYMRHLELWNDFVTMEKEYDGIIQFLFIIEARNGEGDFLYTKLGICNLKHSIYIDENKCLSRGNPQIPSNQVCHTFLLDENNKVILIGDPLRNEEIEKMFFNLVTERLHDKQFVDSLPLEK